VRAWLRALVRWLGGGPWYREPDHWCGACAIGGELVSRLEDVLGPYEVADWEREAMDREFYDREFNEIVRGSW